MLCSLILIYVPFWVFCFIALFCVLFVCKCVLCYCHYCYFVAVIFKQFNDISDNYPLFHILFNLFTVSRAEICLHWTQNRKNIISSS